MPDRYCCTAFLRLRGHHVLRGQPVVLSKPPLARISLAERMCQNRGTRNIPVMATGPRLIEAGTMPA